MNVFSLAAGAAILCFSTISYADRWLDIVDASRSRGKVETVRIAVADDLVPSLLRSPRLRIENSDLNPVPLNGNCFCEYPSSESFAQLNILYFGDQFISQMNPLVESIIGHPLPLISAEILFDNSIAPAGYNTGDGKIRLWLGEANFDPGFLIHEIGHQIHSSLMGKTESELYAEVGRTLDRRAYFEFMGVFEGVANLITALYFDDPVIGKIAWGDISYSMDTRVDYEHMPTERDFNERIANSPYFAERYPSLSLRVRAGLPSLRDAMQPSPYLASQIVFQPLWLYRENYSREEYFRLLFRFLAEPNSQFVSYRDFAQKLIAFTEKRDTHFSGYLKAEYSRRGLLRQL